MTYQLLKGNSLDLLPTLAENSVDAIVTDPPYELGFMGKKWDASGIAYNVELWQQCLRVLKPGGHLLAFGGTRTYHRMTVAIEDAGFEIRDSIHWLYGSGFPKSLDVSKAIDKAAGAEREIVGTKQGTIADPSTGRTDMPGKAVGVKQIGIDIPITAPATEAAKKWDGWGTGLKPAHEPIVLARKPLQGTVANNVLEHGTGALNIDGTRIGDEMRINQPAGLSTNQSNSMMDGWKKGQPKIAIGRWPANLVITHAADCVQIGTKPNTFGGGARGSSGFVEGYDGGGFVGQTVSIDVYDCAAGCPVAELDQQSGITKDGVAVRRNGNAAKGTFPVKIAEGSSDVGYGGRGGASRFFTVTEWDDVTPFLYTAKPSRRERNAGLDGLPAKREADRTKDDGAGGDNPRNRSNTAKVNHHPTVKPLALMRHLVRLVTPPDGTVLDPFAGSGTTMAAAIQENKNVIGIELTEDYWPIIEGRCEWAKENPEQPTKPAQPTPTDYQPELPL